jgi:hypothetical protein
LTSDHAIDAVVRDARVTQRVTRERPISGSVAPRFPRTPAVSCCAMPLVSSSTVSTTDCSSIRGPPRDIRVFLEPGRADAARRCRAWVAAAAGGGQGAGVNRSAGRFPDGADTDSNCADFLTQIATTMPAASAAGRDQY